MGDPEIFIFHDQETLYKTILGEWKKVAAKAIKNHGIFNVALSGGKTPLQFYNYLSYLKNDYVWKQTHIFQVDERFVPPTNPENNFFQIKKYFLNNFKTAHPQTHSISTRWKDIRVCVKEYEKELRQHFNLPLKKWPRFDLIILGIGEDGHTASLFPHAKYIKKTDHLVVTTRSKNNKFQRITLTLPAINHARNIFFLVMGGHKAAITKEILENGNEYPASKVNPSNGTLKFFLDQKAASLLP